MSTARQHARDWFEKRLHEIEQSGDIHPMMYIANTHPKGKSVFMAIDGLIMNSREEKAALGRRVREIIADIEADLVLFVSDTFFAEISDPKLEEVRRRMKWNVEDMAALGLCTKREAVVCLIECKEGPNEIIRQIYERENGRIVFRERVERENTHLMKANFSGFFL